MRQMRGFRQRGNALGQVLMVEYAALPYPIQPRPSLLGQVSDKR